MKLSVGIVGLPNAGKSTLFNALLKKQIADTTNYPFCTIEPNKGIVEVPDGRLKPLADIVKTNKIIPAVIEFIDIAGLVKNAHKGEGLGNQFLGHIRETTIICHVVRFFKDDNVTHVEGMINPNSDVETINTELELADLESSAEYKLSKKPVIYVANIGENQILDKNILGDFKYKPVIKICTQMESDLAELSEEEQRSYLKNYNLEEPGLNRLLKRAYDTLGLISFLTAGKKEVRAWTIKRGETALEASAVIHTDFAKNFIKADVVSFEDFVQYQGWLNCRAAGKVQTKSRDYVVQDGDIVEFKVGC